MTPGEVKNLVQTIVSDLEAVSTVAAGVDPALVPFIAIGKSIANQIPGLAESVTGWLQGNPPTDADVQALLEKLGVLADPNAP